MDERVKLMIWTGVIGGIALIVGGAEYYFLWHSRIYVRQSEIKKLDKKISQMETKKQKIPGLRKKKRKLLKNEQKYRRKLPSLEENTPSEFMEQLHAVSREVGVDVSQYSPSGGGGAQQGGGAGFRTITMSITATGETYRLFRYIWALENEERLMRVQNFSLSVSEQSFPASELQNAAAEGTDAESEDDEMITKYMGTMNLTITIYIYTPPKNQA